MSEENKLQGLFTNDTKTTNGALAFDTTKSHLLDYFFSIVRGSERTRIWELLNKAWTESPQDTAKLIFYKRDCRQGSGERKIFIDSYDWLFSVHPATARLNFGLIPEYGYWKDIFMFWNNNPTQIASIVATQLKKDLANLETGGQVSLLAKWIPTTNNSTGGVPNRKILFAIAKELDLLENQKWHENLRKQYISPLRKHLNIVETKLCHHDFDSINYSQVPSLAFNRYKKLFAKKGGEVFTSWIERVKEGKEKINTSVLFPHQIAAEYIRNNNGQVVETTELQWTDLVNRTRELGVFDKCLAICDVSGSMSGTPMEVSVSLGILMSQCSNNPFFKDKLISFTEKPRFFDLKESKTLVERVRRVMGQVGYNTDFEAVFERLLSYSIQNKVPQSNMPEKLFVFSDMQFDAANQRVKSWEDISDDGSRSETYDQTTFENIKAKYQASGYVMPTIIFWNLSDNKNVPVQIDERNVVMVSGFSEKILSQIMTGSTLSPMSIMRDVIDSERYSMIEIAEDDQ